MGDAFPLEELGYVASLVALSLTGECHYVVVVVRGQFGVFGIPAIIFVKEMLWVFFALSASEIFW